MTDNELDKLLKSIGKEFVTSARNIPEPDYYTSGILRIDKLLGGGWPSGRTITVFGREGAGKTTLALYTIADAQRQGKKCMWIDCEHAFSTEWANVLGVDTDSLMVVQNRSIEHIVEVMASADEAGASIDVIVIDSISALQTMKYFDEDSHQLGMQAKATKEFLFKARYWFPHALVLCLSQETMTPTGSNTPWTPIPTGGKALLHESSYIVRLHFAKSDRKKGVQRVGEMLIERAVAWVDITWLIEKARSSDVGARGLYRVMPGLGIDKVHELFVEALQSGVIIKRAGYYDYKDETIQGADNVIERLRTDSDLLEEVYKDVLRTDTQFEELGPEADSSPEGN